MARPLACSLVAICFTLGLASSNIALPWLGAWTGDNGFFQDRGYAPAPSAHVIDGDWSTYWAGLERNAPQMAWVNFAGLHEITRVVIGERADAFMRSGLLEYHDGWSWRQITAIRKDTPGFVLAFAPVAASAVRLSIHSSTTPSGWYNRVACITAIEVYGVPLDGQPSRAVPQPACAAGRIGMDINDGLEVIGFNPRSPAQYAGVRFGDIVRTINGTSVRSVVHAQQLVAGPPGEIVTLTVWRHTLGRNLTFTVFLECLY